MRFKVLQGKHSAGVDSQTSRQSTFTVGEIVESDERLDKLFVNKFERLPDKGPVTIKKRKNIWDEEPTLEVPVEEVSETPEGEETVLGVEVTNRFPKAEPAGLKVFEKDELFNVADSEKSDVALNEEPMSRTATNKFITNFNKE